MRAEQRIPAIIDDLYAGTLDDAAWQRAMIAVADVVRGVCSCLFVFRPTDGAVLRDEVYRYDPATFAQYKNVWAAKDPRLLPAMQCPVGEAVYEKKLLPLPAWRNSEIYNDFLMPEDTPWFLGFWLHKAPDKVVYLSIQGSRRRGLFDERDGARILPLIPHMRRALEIKDRLERSRVRADSLATSLDSVSFGVMALDSAGRILEVNSVARNLLRAGNGIRRNPDGSLWLREPAGAELDRWILGDTPPLHNTDGLIHVPRPLSRPLSVMVTRLPESPTAWIGTGVPHWILLLFDPDRQLHASVELIARDLNISEREAEIAALLIAGYELPKIAERLCISLNTVRTHLKAIFAKTGMRSQVELIRRLAAGPAAFARSTGHLHADVIRGT